LFVLTAAIVLAFTAYWCTYVVRFTEVAVVTTFGRAEAAAVKNGGAGEAGLYFKWPYPIQSVTKYDTRTRLLQTRSETQVTADNAQIIVESFLAWRVKDPLVFYQRYSSAGPDARDHFREAERTLESVLRSALAEVSRFGLRELFDPRQGASRLGDLEKAIDERLKRADTGAGQQIAAYGIEPTLVGVNRIVLPQETTRTVFERMKANRDALAGEAQAAGETLATTIKNEAQSDATRIRVFAEQRAAEIRNQGDLEAARYIRAFSEAPELAVFLKNLEFMRNGMSKRSTLVLPTTMPGMSVFDPANAPTTAAIPAMGEPVQAGAPTGEKTGESNR
jgi:membrane protease subunit HflC